MSRKCQLKQARVNLISLQDQVASGSLSGQGTLLLLGCLQNLMILCSASCQYLQNTCTYQIHLINLCALLS